MTVKIGKVVVYGEDGELENAKLRDMTDDERNIFKDVVGLCDIIDNSENGQVWERWTDRKELDKYLAANSGAYFDYNDNERNEMLNKWITWERGEWFDENDYIEEIWGKIT